MSKNFSFLGDLIKLGIDKAGLKTAVKEKSALRLWPEVVGAKTATVTKAERVINGIIYVTCRDSMWAQQLHFLRPVIIEKLNERLGGEVIKEIRLSGRGYQKGSNLEEEGPKQENVYERPVLSKEDLEAIEKAVSRIEDPKLAERVRKGLQASRALLRKKME